MAWVDHYVNTGSSAWDVSGSGTQNHTVDVGTASNRYLVVAIYEYDSGNTISGITYNSVSLTKLTGADIADVDGNRVTLWYLANPDSGSNTLAISRSDTHEGGMAWVALKAVKNQAPEATNEAQGENSTHNLTVTSVTDNALIISALTHGDDGAALTPNTGTELQDFLAGSGIAARGGLAGQQAGTAGGQNAGWTSNSNDVYAVAGLSLEVLSADFDQEGFRFRNDDGSESGASWMASQDTDITGASDTNTRLRILLDASGNPATNQFGLQYKLSTDGTYLDVPLVASSSGTPTVNNASSGGNNTTSSSLSVPYPAYSVGDLVVINLIEWVSGEAITNTYPSGPNGETITKLVDTYGSGTGLADTCISIAYYIATSSESAGNFSITCSNTTRWTGSVYRVPAGEFDPNNPISNAVGYDSHTTSNSPTFGAFSANSDDGNGRLIAVIAVDQDPISGTPSGWTDVFDNDQGRASGVVSYRDSLVTASESITPVSWSIAGDAWAGYAYIIRPNESDNAIYIGASSYITAGGENTTAQLTPPSGKTTGDFDAGRIMDDENPADTIDVDEDDYTEVEWNLVANSEVVSVGEVYQFRIVKNGSSLASYSVTPEWTIGTPSQDYDVTKTAEYTVETSEDITKGADYTVATSDTLSKSADYDVVAITIVTKTADYKVATDNDTTKTAQYRIGYPDYAYSQEDVSTLPTDTTDLDYLYLDEDMVKVWSEDDVRKGLDWQENAVVLFKVTHSDSNSEITGSWEGRSNLAPSSKPVYLQVYNYNSGEWETLDSDNTTGANVDFALTGSVTTNLANYYSGNEVAFRVYQAVSAGGGQPVEP